MVRYHDVLIVGSGAAAYSAADWLLRYGVTDVAIVAENRLWGTSRNAGSDKQTYYKVSLSGEKDGIDAMADRLFGGCAVDGKIAKTEAANSARAFFRLVEYGVPFPTDESGAFIGYRTDHDDSDRATSAGPLTSKYMTEALEKKVFESGVVFIDNATVIRIVKEENGACGVLYLNERSEIEGIASGSVVLATGGAGSAYADNVYPDCQSGAMGLAIDAGAALVNFAEWQYGIASVKPKWNLSGSYQQVIPRYCSVDEDGAEREFLFERFGKQALDKIFLKGYQWPFDAAKLGGSSDIDMAVREELLMGRRVYLDYTRNPSGYRSEDLSAEARSYLENAGASDGATPIERLIKLNPQAVDLYRAHGIDLRKEPLRVVVAAQHINGGVLVDTDWQTTVPDLFAVGEAAGTFGVYRPGGAALNSTQVGGLRVARYLVNHPTIRDKAKLIEATENAKNGERASAAKLIGGRGEELLDTGRLMSRYAAHVRDYEKAEALSAVIEDEINDFASRNRVRDKSELKNAYKRYDMLVTQKALLTAILYSKKIGSRGGAIIMSQGRMIPENASYRAKRIVIRGNTVTEEAVCPVPRKKANFEKLLRGEQDG